MEVLNLLALPDPASTVARMAELGVLQVVLPEADAAGLAALVVEEAKQGVEPDSIRRLAALLPANVPLAEQIAARIRLSGAQKKRLALAAGRDEEKFPPLRRWPAESGPEEAHDQALPFSPLPSTVPAATSPNDGALSEARTLAYYLGLTPALDRLLLSGHSIAPLTGWTIPAFPLKGGQIVARGISAGPQVARIRKIVETRWVAEGFPDPARVIALLDAALADAA